MIFEKKTKIVATIGPSSSDSLVIGQLIEKGVDVFRLNFSHGTHDFLDRAIENISEQRRIAGKEIGILADLQGPKIRTGKTFEDRPVTLITGAKVRVTINPLICTETDISIDYTNVIKEVNIGQQIMINDGAIHLKVEQIKDDSLICLVTEGGTYSSRKGVNLPNVDLAIPSLTEKDRNDIEFILTRDIQFIALSFVRKAEDVEELNRIVRQKRKDIKIIAKIEKPEAARRIDEILAVSDGIMVARGDLGVEATPYVVPILQKELIESATKAGKLVIVATQMLESMIQKPAPTRAETTDVANAILESTDAIMLSGETAVGLYPVQAVAMMVQIAKVTENSHYMPRYLIDKSKVSTYPPHAICDSAALASRDMGEIPICVFTLSGETALYMSKRRSPSPLYVFSPDYQVLRVLSLGWNIKSFYLPFANDIFWLQGNAEEMLIRGGYVALGDLIVVVSGTTAVKGATNTLRIKRVGEE